MADQKITQLTEQTTPATGDLLATVDDPGGTPVTMKLTIANLLSLVYPVGSIYTSTASTDSATLFGFGTWGAFGAGRVLVGFDSGDTDFDTSEETGGAKTVASVGTNSAPTVSGSTAAEAAHTHTYTDVPNHVHVQNAPTSASGGALLLQIDTNASGSTASGLSTANPTGGVATGTTAAGSSHTHGAGTLAA